MPEKKKWTYWMELSDYDLETAKAMQKTSRYLYVGFMCHQAVEKALKAFHWKNKNTQPPYIHNLDRIAEKAGALECLNSEQLDLLDELNPLNIETRYPKSKTRLLQVLTDSKCKELISRTQELLNWIKTKL